MNKVLAIIIYLVSVYEFIIHISSAPTPVNWVSDSGNFCTEEFQILKSNPLIYIGRGTINDNNFKITINNNCNGITQNNAKRVFGINMLDFNSSAASISLQIYQTNNGVAGSNDGKVQFQVKILNQTVLYKLKINFALIQQNVPDFQVEKTNKAFTIINQNKGKRSQNVSFDNTNNPDFQFEGAGIKGVVFISGMNVFNPNGTYFYLDWQFYYNSTHYTIMWKTEDFNIISYINFVMVAVDMDFVNGRRYMRKILIDFNECNNVSTNCMGTTPFVQLPDYSNSPFSRLLGLTGFNITKNQFTQWYLDTSSKANYMMGYIQNLSIIKSVKISRLFSVKRDCQNNADFYDPFSGDCDNDCQVNPSSPNKYDYTSGSNKVCVPCHYSCSTCIGRQSTKCDVCDSAHFRSQVGPGPGKQCKCIVNYYDVGVPKCAKCSQLIRGCQNCSSKTACSDCKAGFTKTSSNLCQCTDNSLSLTWNDQCVNLVGCLLFYLNPTLTTPAGVKICTECDTSKNFTLNNSVCICKVGYTLSSAPPYTCGEDAPICGDGIRTRTQQCDDGNIINNDGCDSTCFIQQKFQCFANLRWTSICIPDHTSIRYIGTMKIQKQPTAQAYFVIQPWNKYFSTNTSLSPWLFSSISNYSIYSNIQYSIHQLNTAQYIVFKLKFDYSEAIKSSIVYNMTYNISDTNHSYVTYTNFSMKGQNYPLNLTEGSSSYEALSYLILILIILAFLASIISVFSQKWIGIQLLNLYQFSFFYYSLLTTIDYDIYDFLSFLQFSNGFNWIYNNISIFEYRMFHSKLYLMRFRGQIFYNFNISALFYVIPLTLILIKLVKNIIQKCKHYNNNKKSKYASIQQKWYLTKQFIIDNVFLTITVVFTNQIMFINFVTVGEHHYYYENYIFSSFLSQFYVLILFLFIITVFGILFMKAISPEHRQRQQVKQIEQELDQTNLQDKINVLKKINRFSSLYPLIYFLIQLIKIIFLSVLYDYGFTVYIFLSIQAVYLIGFIIVRPYRPQTYYSNSENYCYSLHNLHNIWNSIGLIIVLIIILNDNLSTENKLEIILAYIIFFIFLISLILAILRLFASRKLAEVWKNCNRRSQFIQRQNPSVQMQNTNRPIRQQKQRNHKTSNRKAGTVTSKQAKRVDNTAPQRSRKKMNIKK